MNDLEICKRIAEIEGEYDLVMNNVESNNKHLVHVQTKLSLLSFYNPLTDDALCFQFVVELQLRVMYTECPAGTGKAYFVGDGINQTDYCDTANRAVCMAKLGIFNYE